MVLQETSLYSVSVASSIITWLLSVWSLEKQRKIHILPNLSEAFHKLNIKERQSHWRLFSFMCCIVQEMQHLSLGSYLTAQRWD